MAPTEGEAREQAASPAVGFSQRVGRPATPRDLSQATVIKTHDVEDRARQRSNERRLNRVIDVLLGCNSIGEGQAPRISWIC